MCSGEQFLRRGPSAARNCLEIFWEAQRQHQQLKQIENNNTAKTKTTTTTTPKEMKNFSFSPNYLQDVGFCQIGSQISPFLKEFEQTLTSHQRLGTS
jgi:hypothetical protein